MSLRTIQRLAMASVLALGGISATGCDDDDDDTKPVDGGDGGDGSDGGDGGDGEDGGDGGDGSDDLICTTPADTVCEPTDTGIVPLEPCCDEATGGACGAQVPAQIAGGLAGCFAKNQPGNDASQNCDTFIDWLDGVDDEDDAFNFEAPVGIVKLNGCCAATGECGIFINELGVGGNAAALGLGCVPFTRFAAAFAPGGDDAGVPDAGTGEEPPQILPYCVPGKETDDAACPKNMAITETVNLCDALAEGGLPITDCIRAAMTPPWVCALRQLPLAVEDGEVPAPDGVGDCMDFLPKWLPGCVGAPAGTTSCVPNVAVTVFGCEDQPISDNGTPDDATDDCLIGLPEYARGCGETPTPSCLPNTPALFGCVDVTAGPIPNLPEYACGCGDGVVAAGCLPNVAASICGAVPHTTGDVPNVPEYVCGCGDGVRGNGQCIPNVPNTTCGAIEVTTGQVPNLPNAVCGCGDEMLGQGCIPNVPNTVCGAIARCTEGEAGSGAGSATTCADGEICLDNTGGGGTNNGGDDIGDACGPAT